MSEIKAVITLNRTEFPIIVPWSGSGINSAQIGVTAHNSTVDGVKLIDMPNPPADLGYSWKISRFRNGQVSVGQPGSPGKSEAVLAVRDLRTLTAEAELWLQLDRNGEAVATATRWVPLIQGYTIATDSPGSRPNLAKPDFDRLVASYPEKWLLREGFLPKFIGTKEEMFELRDSDTVVEPPPPPPPPPPNGDDNPLPPDGERVKKGISFAEDDGFLEVEMTDREVVHLLNTGVLIATSTFLVSTVNQEAFLKALADFRASAPPPPPPPPPPEDDEGDGIPDDDEDGEDEVTEPPKEFGRYEQALAVRVRPELKNETAIFLMAARKTEVFVTLLRSVKDPAAPGDVVRAYGFTLGAYNPFVRNLWQDLGHTEDIDAVSVVSDHPLATCSIWQMPKGAPVTFAGFAGLEIKK